MTFESVFISEQNIIIAMSVEEHRPLRRSESTSTTSERIDSESEVRYSDSFLIVMHFPRCTPLIHCVVYGEASFVLCAC